ncbi:hypothetical protein [Paraburkholderia fungorum]|uniref:Uncharacterized protein n=1 Tax=Paraburkholderia fungorum TaxID=134537 RepID=A0AAP5US08_9BURK|nr:hypothetical protein [Paraburkholderia fungorum]MBB5542141.1 hypothetical protein [Paraburkholderia fungorum]MDT8836505.1 hypothetical protein [Paraburkholderia fungorum]PRZ54655.1 hypothetical protein BX589_106190 [Paraburkholderia fungorum]
MQGIIYRIDQPLKSLQLTAPLEGKYLLQPVHSSTMTSGRQTANDPLLFRFFSGSDRSVVFCFCPTDSLTTGAVGQAWGRATQLVERGAVPEEIGRFVWSNNSTVTTISEISTFFRSSATLTESDYLPVARVRATVDAKGMAILSTEPGGERAGRALTAYMLGLAYHRVLEQAIHDLAECCRDDSKVKRTEAMHSEISRFIASYYFDAPARVFTTEVGPLYKAIHDRLLLASLRHELVDQLGRIAEIIRIERTATESAFEAKVQKRLTVLGVFIGILGLAQLTQTTPAQIQTFASGWTAALRGGPPDVSSSGQPSPTTKQADSRAEVQPHKLRRVRHDMTNQAQ